MTAISQPVATSLITAITLALGTQESFAQMVEATPVATQFLLSGLGVAAWGGGIFLLVWLVRWGMRRYKETFDRTQSKHALDKELLEAQVRLAKAQAAIAEQEASMAAKRST